MLAALRARTGLVRCSKNPLLDHLVGERLDRVGHLDAERLGGRKIDHEIEPGRLLDREVGRLRPAQNLVDIVGGAAEQVRKVGSIGHQTFRFDQFPTDVNRRQSRGEGGQVEARLANTPPCLIGMEACVGAHHLSRKLQALGHDARLMPAKYVRPYSKGQKNDFRDAEAIAEAVQRPTMRFVATKTGDQLDLQALHRVRARLVGQRTGIINQIRAFLLERGVAVRQGLRFLRIELPGILAKRTDVLGDA